MLNSPPLIQGPPREARRSWSLAGIRVSPDHFAARKRARGSNKSRDMRGADRGVGEGDEGVLPSNEDAAVDSRSRYT